MENKPKFTSGPWTNENGNIRGKWETGEEIALAITGVTTFCGEQSGGPEAKRMKEENAANAALISAAPEMYAALVEVEEASRKRRPVKKAVWLKVCEILRKVDGQYR